MPLQAQGVDVEWWQRALSAAGLFGLLAVAWVLSERRRAFPLRVVAWGLGLQWLFGLAVLKTSFGVALFSWANTGVTRLLEFSDIGTRFIFGNLIENRGFVFALQVLPTIVFFSSLMSILYHLGWMQRVVAAVAWVMRRTMRTSAAETLSTAANIFVGQTEAPLTIRPYIEMMTRSELMAVMVGGFATVAGGVLAAYVGMLRSTFPDIAGHLIAASVMSAPAALAVAKVMVPETEKPHEAAALGTHPGKSQERTTENVVDAAARGAADGLKLALNVGAMLLAFIALVALVNAVIAWPAELYNDWVGTEALRPWSLQELLGYVLWPLAFLTGIAPEDCHLVGSLFAEKIVLNEFVAFAHLAELLQGSAVLSPRSAIIATYGLCGFANFGSIAIQIGGIGAIAPSRRGELAQLGLRAMVGGILAACMTGAIAGVLL